MKFPFEFFETQATGLPIPRNTSTAVLSGKFAVTAWTAATVSIPHFASTVRQSVLRALASDHTAAVAASPEAVR